MDVRRYQERHSRQRDQGKQRCKARKHRMGAGGHQGVYFGWNEGCEREEVQGKVRLEVWGQIMEGLKWEAKEIELDFPSGEELLGF